MNIVDMRTYRYSLPLASPLALKGVEHTVRAGVLVRMDTAEGVTAWGDIAPLPGFSRETLERATEEACWTADSIMGRTDTMYSDSPSVDFGFMSAYERIRAAKPSPAGAARRVRVNALVDGDAGAIAVRAAQLREAGYPAVKLKVGRMLFAEDVDRVFALAAAVGPKVAIRLDANRAWTLGEALEFWQQVRDLNVEYIEEPLMDPEELPELHRRSRMPVALDESMVEDLFPDWALAPWVAAVVLKPTLLGFTSASSLAYTAGRHGITCVVSACYESGVGLSSLIQLAATLPDVPHGLDTGAWLAEDVLRERLEIRDGAFDVAESIRRGMDVDEARIEEATGA